MFTALHFKERLNQNPFKPFRIHMSEAVTIHLGRTFLLDLFAQGVVVRRLQITFEYARASLLALCKNLLRNNILPK
ncbi:MAG TPA: hypothetical protein VGN61_14170 [Verrucomicrobiae bacterium]|jgi:hypothetical protein